MNNNEILSLAIVDEKDSSTPNISEHWNKICSINANENVEEDLNNVIQKVNPLLGSSEIKRSSDEAKILIDIDNDSLKKEKDSKSVY